MNRVVLKYGGSSVSTLEKIMAVADQVMARAQQGMQIVVVVSAMGKTTNTLIESTRQISDTPDKRELDMLLATGEQTSAAYLAMTLIHRGVASISLTGGQAGIHTYGPHTKALIDTIDTQRIEQHLAEAKVVVVTGFQGIDACQDITTLGRGGSDTSAVALACALQCPCEIYTDVEGIYTVDPHLYPAAKKIQSLGFDETMEMANLGAKVIEPRSVELASRYKIPIYIALNTGKVPGTTLRNMDDSLEQHFIRNVSVLDDVAYVNCHKLGHDPKRFVDLFQHIAHEGINIDVVTQNFNDDIAFTVTGSDLPHIKEILESWQLAGYDTRDDMVKVSVIGNAMRNQPGVAANIFSVFVEHNVKFHQVSTSEISISYIIDKEDKAKIVTALAEAFNL